MKKIFSIAAFSLCTLALAAPSMAQHQRGGAAPRGGGGAVARPGGPRGGGAPRGGYYGGGYYRGGYYGRYHGYYGYPGWSLGFYGGYPYYSPYYYPWGYYGYYGSPYWGVGWGYPYVDRDTARGFGGVQIKDAPKDAQVFADGYYAGTVDDFDGAFQHLDLEAGPHHIEIREPGKPPVAFEVNVLPGETTTYHAR